MQITFYMRNFSIFVLLLCSTIAWAQEQHNEDSLQNEKPKNFQLYIAPAYALNQFVETQASFFGVHLGIAYKGKVDLNISYSAILDRFKKQIVFPTAHNYSQKIFGVNAQYAFLENRITPHAGLGFQYSRVSWSPENENGEEFLDYIYQLKPFIGVVWKIHNAFTIDLNSGYLIAPEVDLVGLAAEDFTGFSFNLMIKMGFYSF